MVITGKRYKKELVHDKKFDVIIIGSGLSALTMGSYLSKHKKQKVLLLEKHYTAGGFTHMFKRKEYQWDVGVHYVGELQREGSFFQKLFNYISDGQLKWAPLDEVYDHVFIGEKHYSLKTGVKNYKEELYRAFPNEQDRKAIDAYVNLCFEINKSVPTFYLNKMMPPLLRKLTAPLLGKKFRRFASKTTLEMMKTLTNNKELIAVLTAQYGDYGVPPKESSFVVQAMVSKHYFAGGSYPIGGAVNFANTIIPVIEKNEGLVLTHAGVKQILVEGDKAVGVELENGDKIYAPKIVSSAGVHRTFQDLLPADNPVAKSLSNKSKKLPPSMGHVCLYIGLNGSAKELELPKANYWIYPHNDYDQAIKDFCQDYNKELPITYISFPGAKDPHWIENHPNKTTVEIITVAPYEWFQKWESAPWGKRGEEYEKFKEFLSQKLLEKLYKHSPKTKGKVDYYELSTPLSTKHFCSYKKGEVYGLDHRPERFLAEWITPDTPIKNLFMTGQDIVTVGIGPSALAGLLTASSMTKENTLNIITKQ